MLKALEDGKAALYLTKSCVDSCVVKDSGKRSGRRSGMYYGMDKATAKELLSQGLSLVVANSTKPSFLNKESINETGPSLHPWPLQTDSSAIIETDRDVIVPKEKTELLRVLAHFAELPLDYCSVEAGDYMKSVKQSILTILAKVDFTLLERGEDMMELCKIVRLNYYERSTDLKLCGEPMSLIEYYMGKLIKKKEEQVSSWVVNFTEYMNKLYGIPLLQGIMAYYDIVPVNFIGEFDQDVRDKYIKAYSELQEPDYYRDLDRLYDEIRREIKSRSGNEHSLAIYLIGILSPFATLSALLFKDVDTDQENIYAIRAIFNLAPRFLYYSDKAFKVVWEQSIAEAKILKYESNQAFYGEVIRIMEEKYKEPSAEEFSIESMHRLFHLYFNFQDFESCIEASLLEIASKHDYLYYERLAGVSLGESVSDLCVYNVNEWTTDSVKSMAKALKHRVKDSGPSLGNDIVIYDRLFGNSPSQEEPIPSALPKELLPAKPYLDALQEDGLVDKNYKWTGNRGNKHAAWASKIIIHNCPGVHHSMVGRLFGIENIGSYVSDAKDASGVAAYIEKLFINKGLSIVVP